MEWISVKEKMPPIGAWVMIYDPSMQFFDLSVPPLMYEMVCRISQNKYLTTDGSMTIWEDITHWMHLPEIPTDVV